MGVQCYVVRRRGDEECLNSALNGVNEIEEGGAEEWRGNIVMLSTTSGATG